MRINKVINTEGRRILRRLLAITIFNYHLYKEDNITKYLEKELGLETLRDIKLIVDIDGTLNKVEQLEERTFGKILEAIS